MLTNYIEIDIDKIINNIEKVKNMNNQTPICAVVKANAYGLGAVPIATYIEDYVSYFAVARYSEAKALRISGIKKPILILGYVSIEEAIKCAEYDIDICIFDLDYTFEIDRALEDKKLNGHLAIDTGHTRLGFRSYETQKILSLKDLKNINIRGAFTHYATADEKDMSFSKLQTKLFEDTISKIRDELNIENVHIANSAAGINFDVKSDMIRLGISMYGIYPSNYLKETSNIELEKVFKFKSRIAFVKDVKKGTPISYGRTFYTPKDMKIATVPIGYADGYIRAFSNEGEVLVNGRNSRVCGRVCMDQMMIDVTDIECKIGDEVELYSDIYKEANKINTIAYELMTSFDMRLVRLYKKDGEVIKVDDYIGEIYEN